MAAIATWLPVLIHKKLIYLLEKTPILCPPEDKVVSIREQPLRKGQVHFIKGKVR